MRLTRLALHTDYSSDGEESTTSTGHTTASPGSSLRSSEHAANNASTIPIYENQRAPLQAHMVATTTTSATSVLFDDLSGLMDDDPIQANGAGARDFVFLLHVIRHAFSLCDLP